MIKIKIYIIIYWILVTFLLLFLLLWPFNSLDDVYHVLQIQCFEKSTTRVNQLEESFAYNRGTKRESGTKDKGVRVGNNGWEGSTTPPT